MARRRFHAMTKSGVSIRLVPTVLFVDAVAKTGAFQAIPNMLSSPSGAGQQLQNMGQMALGNIGGITLDVIGAILWTKVFPRTPGLRLGRFRVSL